MLQWQLRRVARAREALTLSAATLDQALSAMADGFLLCDAQDRVLRWNQRYLELFPWLGAVIATGVPYLRLAECAVEVMLPGAPPEEREAWVEHRMALHRGGDRVWESDLRNGVVVGYTSVRRKPSRSKVDSCTTLYAQMVAQEGSTS